MYSVGDTITLKTLKKLELLKKTSETTGFYITSGLFINEGMFKFLGQKYKIIKVISNHFCAKGIGYKLDNDLMNNKYVSSWTWDNLCFEENKQLELEF